MKEKEAKLANRLPRTESSSRLLSIRVGIDDLQLDLRLGRRQWKLLLEIGNAENFDLNMDLWLLRVESDLMKHIEEANGCSFG